MRLRKFEGFEIAIEAFLFFDGFTVVVVFVYIRPIRIRRSDRSSKTDHLYSK